MQGNPGEEVVPLAKILGYRYSVIWGNPETEPPEGFERVHMTSGVVKRAGAIPPELEAERERLKELHGYDVHFGVGYGCSERSPKFTRPANPWSISVSCIQTEPKTISSMGRHKIRRKRLWARLYKKYPLEAEILYREEVEKRREYFGVWTKEIPIPPSEGNPTAHEGRRLATW